MSQQIYVAADGTVRGPFTNSPGPVTGETTVTLTDAQYAQLTTLRTANPTVTKWKWDGTQFLVHPIETLRAGLISEYNALPAFDQAQFAPVFQAIKAKLDAGDMAGAKAIISTAHDLNSTLSAAQTAMLALFPS